MNKFKVVDKGDNRVRVKGDYHPQGTITVLANYKGTHQVWHVRSRPVKYLLVKIFQEAGETYGEVLDSQQPGRNWYATLTKLKQRAQQFSRQ